MRKDALAGVTTAAVVIPQAMAYATIAGLPVQVGLYTALVPLLVHALLGTSRALSVSTTSTLAALTGAAVASVPAEDAMAATTTLALLAGALLLAADFLKLGFLADFISHPVLAGFKAGTGLLIASGRLGKVLGVDLTGHVPGGLPTPVAPDLSLIGPLLPAAAGIALMSFVESIAAGRAMSRADEHEPDADEELLALGGANLAGGVFRGLPAGGGLSQTSRQRRRRDQARRRGDRARHARHAAVPDEPVRRPPPGHARGAHAREHAGARPRAQPPAHRAPRQRRHPHPWPALLRERPTRAAARARARPGPRPRRVRGHRHRRHGGARPAGASPRACTA